MKITKYFKKTFLFQINIVLYIFKIFEKVFNFLLSLYRKKEKFSYV